MKNSNALPEEAYTKQVGRGRFLLYWIPLSTVWILIVVSIWISIGLVFDILFDENYSIIESIKGESFLAGPTIPLVVGSVVFFWQGLRLYHLIKKEQFALITNEKLIISFGRSSFRWSDIHSIHVEGKWKLAVLYDKGGKLERRLADLRWFPKKEEFINRLENTCTEKNIPFCEGELTLFSEIKMLMGDGL
jgi:hypothetical protein